MHPKQCLLSNPDTVSLAHNIEQTLQGRRVKRTEVEGIGEVSARYLAARHVMSEVVALSLNVRNNGADGEYARKAAECEDASEKLKAASSVQAGLLEPVRKVLSGASDPDPTACKQRAGDYIRPLLAQVVEAQAEACASLVDDSDNLVREVNSLQNRKKNAKSLLIREDQALDMLRSDINTCLHDVVQRTCAVVSHRIAAERCDDSYTGHLIALLEALRSKILVLTAEVELVSYDDKTLSVLMHLRDVLDQATGSAQLEEQALMTLVDQYNEAEAASVDFNRINEECKILEKEQAALLAQLQKRGHQPSEVVSLKR
ncbi:hypothetical protein DIPPA_21753 [Diplonema papillatum]|nr:hypothetical protein DIPPA_21753 [Diplonema papillatum]